MHMIISQGIIFSSDSCNHYMRYVYLCLSGIVYCFFHSLSHIVSFPNFHAVVKFGSRMGKLFMLLCSSEFSDTFLWGLLECFGYHIKVKKDKACALPVSAAWAGSEAATRQLQSALAQHLQPGCAYWDECCVMDTSCLAGGPWGRWVGLIRWDEQWFARATAGRGPCCASKHRDEAGRAIYPCLSGTAATCTELPPFFPGALLRHPLLYPHRGQ